MERTVMLNFILPFFLFPRFPFSKYRIVVISVFQLQRKYQFHYHRFPIELHHAGTAAKGVLAEVGRRQSLRLEHETAVLASRCVPPGYSLPGDKSLERLPKK